MVADQLEARGISDPELLRAYQEWDRGRRQFHEQKAKGEVRPDDWQRDYFQGRDAVGVAMDGDVSCAFVKDA